MCNIFAEAETGWSPYPESRKWWLARFSYRMFWSYKYLVKESMCTQFQSKMTFCIINPVSIPLSPSKFYRTFWSGVVLNFIWPTRFLPDMSGGPTDLRKHWGWNDRQRVHHDAIRITIQSSWYDTYRDMLYTCTAEKWKNILIFGSQSLQL